jgi:hypothetical protein
VLWRPTASSPGKDYDIIMSQSKQHMQNSYATKAMCGELVVMNFMA